MDLKILSFNKTLFKKDFNMVKFLILFVAGMIFATTTVHIISREYAFNNLQEYYVEHGIEYNKESLVKGYKDEVNWRIGDCNSNGANIFFIFGMPIALIAILFGEEKRKRTFEILKVMPYTRYEIFFNKLLVALASIVLPFVINGLIMILALAFSPNLRMFYSAGQVIKWILLYIYYQFPILGFTLIFGTLTANTISHVILTIIFLIFPMGFTTLIFWNLDMFGLNLGNINIFVENIYMDIMNYPPLGVLINQGAESYIIYTLISFVMIVLAKILFDKNKIERNGEILEFKNTEGFFKFGVSICTALLMGTIFAWIFNDFVSLSQVSVVLVMLLGYILGGILGYLVANVSIKAIDPKPSAPVHQKCKGDSPYCSPVFSSPQQVLFYDIDYVSIIGVILYNIKGQKDDCKMKKGLKWFDNTLIHIINHKLNNKSLDKFMLIFTNFGGVICTTCFTLLLILLGKTRFTGLQVAVTLAISQTITYVLKALLSRERPYNILKNLNTFDIILKDYSFPSGHTSASFAIATSIAFNMPKLSILVFLVALLIGISRIYLGVHYPTDVAAGIIVGVGSAAMTHAFLLNFIANIMNIIE